MIVGVKDNLVMLANKGLPTFQELFEGYTFSDGSICGIPDKFDLSFIDIIQNLKEGQKFINENGKILFFKNNTLFMKNNGDPIKVIVDLLTINIKYKAYQ